MSQKDSTDEVVKDWFGQLPEGWSLRRLRTLGRFSSSGIDKKTVEGEPLVRMVNYTDVYGNLTHELRNSPDYMVVSCPANKVEEHGLVQGDMLLTPSSETPEDIGVSAVVMEDLDNTVYSYHITRFRMRDEVSLRYRKYLCNHPRVLRQFSRLCKGTTRQILVREDFKSAWVAVPPPDQHDRIAAYLDAATGKIDRLMSLRRRQMELLREQRAALIQQAVTRGLNPRAPLKDSGLPWLGQIPMHWKVKRLKHIAYFVQTGGTPPSGNLEFYHEEGMNWFGPGDFGDDLVLGKSARRISEAALSSGHAVVYEPPVILVVGIGASVGKVGLAIERCFTNQQVNAVGLRKPHSTHFFGYFLAVHSSIIAANSNQATLPIFNQTQTGNFPVPVPPPDEQERILAYIQRETAKLDTLYRSYEWQLALLAEYRASLIHECVTGQRAIRN